MSERYSKLYALPANLYAAGSPVIIAAGSLLKDNQTGKVLAQLKLRNIAKKTIKAATVYVEPLDTVGKPLGEVVSYQYLDLHADRDVDFGQKTPIALPNSATRSFAVSVEEIVFADNSIWRATGEPWEALPTPTPLSRFGDTELEKQFRLKYGENSRSLPRIEKDLWYCTCGELNRKGEAQCHRCGKSYEMLKSIDLDELKRERDSRRAVEKEQAEKDAAAAKAKSQKMMKIAAVVIPIVVVIIAATVIISGMVEKNNAYKDALALMDAGQYEEAIKAFTALDGYKDSTEQIQLAENAIAEIARAEELEATYNNAIQLLESDVSANENEAYHILMELGDYKDAKELLADFRYAIITEATENFVEDYTWFYEYDASGFLTAKGDTVYSYDDNGRLIKEADLFDWQTTEYWYNDNGTLKMTKHAISQSESSNKTDYTTIECDNQGYPIRIANEFTGDVWDYEYNRADDGEIDSIRVSHRYYGRSDSDAEIIIDMSKYDSRELPPSADQGFPLFWIVNEDGSKKTSYRLDHNYFDGIIIEEKDTYEYDSYGNLTRKKLYDYYDYSYENSYDEMGNLTQTIRKGSTAAVTYNYIYGYIYTPDAA